MTVDTSRTLLGLISRNDSHDSWRVFVSIYRPFILKCIAVRQVPSGDADDLCQETLTQVFRGIQGFHHNGRPGAFRTWSVTIVSHRVWSYFQNRQRSEEAARVAQQSAALNFDTLKNEMAQQWEREHDRYLVEKMLELVRGEFSETSWQAFRRVVLEGETPSDAAAQLGISVNAVLIAKSRMMRRLKQFGAGMVQNLDSPAPGGVE